MPEVQITLADSIKDDPYPLDHPWSIQVENQEWRNAVVIRQGGLGARPLYCLKTGSQQIIGSDFSGLAGLAENLTPCVDARMELLLFGHTTGCRTLYKEIQRLPPGDRHSITPSGVTSEWSDRIVDLGPVTLQQAASRFIDTLRLRIDRHPTGWLPLTGGVDSRTIASVVAGATGIRAYTRGTDRHMEVKRASTVSAITGLNHYPLPFLPGYLQNNVFAIAGLTGGMVSVDHSHAIHPLDHLNRLSGGVVIPGMNGEYGRCFFRTRDVKAHRSNPEDMGRHLFDSNLITRNGGYKDLFPEDTNTIKDRLRDEFVERYRIIAEHSRFSHPIAWNDEFYLRERVRSFTSFGGVIWNDFFHLIIPFLEPDYIQAVRHLSPSFRSEPHIHREIIRQTKPNLLRIPLHPSEQPLERKPIDVIGSPLRRMRKRFMGEGCRKGVQNYPMWLRHESAFLQPFILEMHNASCGLVIPSTVASLLADHMKGADHHRILLRLATLGVCDKIFLPTPTGQPRKTEHES